MPSSLNSAARVLATLEALGNTTDAAFLQRYFRTGPGGYGEGDRFLGIRVPAVRRVARGLDALPLAEVDRLLGSAWHEARLAALLTLVRRYPRADAAGQKAIYDLYLARTDRINNWDLVDVSAPHVVGAHLAARSRAPLHRLARSASVWERRIAIMATLHFIRAGDVEETLALAERLLHDEHDLIHKSVGWMLREAWRRVPVRVEPFMREHCRSMPRTMLRYAIERQPDRQQWLIWSREPQR